MNDPIIVIDAERTHCGAICKMLEAHGYRGIQAQSLVDITNLIQESDSRVVIWNLDTVPVENRQFRNLKKKHPGLCILAVSERLFHPELKEAMTTSIYACLCKPVDPDDLIYLVKSIFCNATNPRKNPVEKGMVGRSFTTK